MTPAEKLFLKIGSSIQGATQSQMFGWSCFKIGKTAFISFENDCMIFKLPPHLIEEALQLEGTYIFMPNKKTAMKNWVCIPYHHKKTWALYAEEAKQFIKNNGK
jgi:hypothetical protein